MNDSEVQPTGTTAADGLAVTNWACAGSVRNGSIFQHVVEGQAQEATVPRAKRKQQRIKARDEPANGGARQRGRRPTHHRNVLTASNPGWAGMSAHRAQELRRSSLSATPAFFFFFFFVFFFFFPLFFLQPRQLFTDSGQLSSTPLRPPSSSGPPRLLQLKNKNKKSLGEEGGRKENRLAVLHHVCFLKC